MSSWKHVQCTKTVALKCGVTQGGGASAPSGDTPPQSQAEKTADFLTISKQNVTYLSEFFLFIFIWMGNKQHILLWCDEPKPHFQFHFMGSLKPSFCNMFINWFNSFAMFYIWQCFQLHFHLTLLSPFLLLFNPYSQITNSIGIGIIWSLIIHCSIFHLPSNIGEFVLVVWPILNPLQSCVSVFTFIEASFWSRGLR